MTETRDESNAAPLSDRQIKAEIALRGTSIAALARLATDELGYTVTAWQLKAVIHRYSGVVYPSLRVWLAGWLGCHVSQVGNEPATRRVKRAEARARAA